MVTEIFQLSKARKEKAYRLQSFSSFPLLSLVLAKCRWNNCEKLGKTKKVRPLWMGKTVTPYRLLKLYYKIDALSSPEPKVLSMLN
jgi:hypothetical protein